MDNNLSDPQISAAIIQGKSTILAALIGGVIAFWGYLRNLRKKDPRCLRACESMVSVTEILIVAIRMVGANHPALLHEVDRAQDKVNETKAWLNEESTR